MFRIKWICGLMLVALLVSACGQGNSGLNGESMGEENFAESDVEKEESVAQKEEDGTYETAVVGKADFTYTIDVSSARTEFYFPQKEVIRCEYSGAYMKETVAWRRGDEVKKGQALFTLCIEGRDELVEERLQLEYQRLSQEYKDQVQQYESEIAILAQSIAGAQESERNKLELQKEKMETELRIYQTEAGASVTQAKESLDEYKEKYSDKTIVAPFDGVISYNYREKEGETVEYGAELFTIHKQEEALLSIEARALGGIAEAISEYHLFVQELPVSIIVDREESIPAKIVGSPVGTEAVNGSEAEKAIYIAAEDQEAMQALLERDSAGVSSITIQLPDVLVVDSTYTVMKDNTKPDPGNGAINKNLQNTGYVYLLEDGKVIKQRVLLGPIVAREKGVEYAIVLQGLTEGQVVVVGMNETEE